MNAKTMRVWLTQRPSREGLKGKMLLYKVLSDYGRVEYIEEFTLSSDNLFLFGFCSRQFEAIPKRE
jgi:hypothetical protein